MPLTYLSHQAAVLPLKAWRPAWFAVPAAVAVTVIVRRLEPRLIAALPVAPRWARAVARRHPAPRSLLVVAACAALGILTHIVWDMFTVLLLAIVGRSRAVLSWRPEERRPLPRRLDWRVTVVTALAAAGGALWASGAHHDLAAGVNRLVLTAGAGFVAAASIFINDDPLEDGHAEQP